MKITLEIPDELMQRVRLRAAGNGQKLKDTIAELLEKGMSDDAMHVKAKRLPKPIKLKNNTLFSTGDIERAIASGREL